VARTWFGRFAHDVDERRALLLRHLLALRKVEARAGIGVEVLADLVHVVQRMQEQSAGPVGRGQRLRDE